MDYRKVWSKLPECGTFPIEICEMETEKTKMKQLQLDIAHCQRKISEKEIYLDRIMQENWTEQELMDAGYKV
jgi:hypothetical protein